MGAYDAVAARDRPHANDIDVKYGIIMGIEMDLF